MTDKNYLNGGPPNRPMNERRAAEQAMIAVSRQKLLTQFIDTTEGQDDDQ